MHFKIENYKTDEKIMAILVKRNIYTGGTRGILVDRSNNTTLYTHEKSITSISSYKNYIACTSYDCTTAVIKDNKLFDVIEGPETEVKGVSFSEDGNFIALATRGKSVWLCKFGEYIEIDKILEDHTEDVKGCKFYKSFLFTFGYDTTIKIYNYFELTDTYELVQDLTIGHTVWDIVVEENIFYVASDDGELICFSLFEDWKETNRVKLGITPIYSICKFKDLLVCGVNGGNLVFLNAKLEVVHVLENLHSNFINCIFYSEEDGVLATGSDDCSYSVLTEATNKD